MMSVKGTLEVFVKWRTMRGVAAPRFLGLLLVVALLLVMSGGAVGTSRPLNASAQSSVNNDLVDLEGAGSTDQRASQASFVAANGDSDWPQVQRDPQRTGYTPEVLGTNFEVVWTHPFQPEKIYPQVQAIVYSGKAFVGTEMGNMYALDAQTGEEEWIYGVGAPILNSVAAGDGKVFFGAMDGAVYALDATSGSLMWKSQLSWRLGFSTAPVLAENRVMLGGRNGVFYALEPDTGTVLWQYDVGSPILQTAAWNNGRAFFGALNMHVYAINTADGSLAWQSEKIPGMAFKDYWPVVYAGQVLVRPTPPTAYYPGIKPTFPFSVWFSSDTHWNWLMQHGPAIAEGRLTDVPDAMDAQDDVMASYQANPDDFIKTLYILDETTGEEAFVVPHWAAQTMNGATTPPCVDRDGRLIIPVFFVRSGWGRLDLAAQRITDILYDHMDASGGPMGPGDYPAGMGNLDENLNVTCTGDLIIALHTLEGNANYTGVFDLDNRMWTRLGRGHTNRQMGPNTQGGGGNPASVSNGTVYHISFHELIARVTQP